MVVIPVKDDATRLRACLRALSTQSRPPDGVLVVDNGSTDDTWDVVRAAGVRYLFHPEPGIAAAASAGYDAADADLVGRVDADTVVPSDWAARVQRAFADDPGLDALTGPGEFASLPAPLRWAADRGYMRAYFRLYGRALGHPPLFGSNLVLTRELWGRCRDRVHRSDPEVHDDLDLSYTLPDDARVRYDPELRVRISARPFLDPVAFARRIRRALHTTRVNRGPREADG